MPELRQMGHNVLPHLLGTIVPVPFRQATTPEESPDPRRVDFVEMVPCLDQRPRRLDPMGR